MSINIEVVNTEIDKKNSIISVDFKCTKSSSNGAYKTFNQCTFKPDQKAKTFVDLLDVTDDLIVSWVEKKLGEQGLKDIETTIAKRIKIDSQLNKKD